MDPKTNKALQIFLNASTGFLGLALIIFAVMASASYKNASSVSNGSDTIEVSGKGSVQAVPNIARISFGHKEEAKDLQTAQANLEKVISASLQSLSDFGIEEKDIKQQNYNAYPQYVYKSNCAGFGCIDGNRELVAYEVSQSIQVIVRDLNKVGEVVALLGQSGATELYGPTFEIEDPTVYQQEARAIAIENAREEAKVLSKSLGVRLGKMVDFYENTGGYPMPYMRSGVSEDAMASGVELKEVSIPVGEDTVEIQVTLIFKVK